MANPLQIPGGEPTVKVAGVVEQRLRVVQCTRSLGGGRLDSCALEIDVSDRSRGFVGVGDLLQQTTLLDLLDGKEIEVLLPVQKQAVGKKKQTEPTVIHWGQASIVRAVLGTEMGVSLVSRIEPRHFGKPLRGRQSYAKLASGRIFESRFDRACVFNPVIDGRAIGNMSNRGWSVDGKTQNGHAFLDEEAGRSTLAARWLKEPQDVEERETKPAGKHLWTLPLAVNYLCSALNAKEEFIKNPSLGGLLEELMRPEPDSLLRDFHLEDGLRLPECLDRLLTPFGYVWWVDLRPGVRQIKVARRSEGERVHVYHQPAGEALDPARTNNERLDLQLDCSSGAFNRLTLLGDYEEVEGTFELVRGWSAANDARIEEANIGADVATWTANPEYQDVWRKWALNEAGDYVGLRPDITKPFDHKTIFKKDEDWLPRRRRFWPCLTRNPDGTPFGNKNGFHVEISGDSGATWLSVETDENGQCEILDRECGLVFNGRMPPELLTGNAAGAKVRITATLRSDRRLTAEVEKSAAHERAAPYEIEESIVLDGRFHLRSVHKTSINYEHVHDGTVKSDAADDTLDLKVFADRLLDAANLADVRGTIVLTGINWSYDLGQSVEGIAGRNVFFTLDKAGKKFPLIDSLTYDVREQTLTLGLRKIDDVPQMPLRERRRR